MFKNIHFNPKINTIEDVLKREDAQGLEFEKVVYCNEYEAVAVFVLQSKISVNTQSIGCIRCNDNGCPACENIKLFYRNTLSRCL